MSKGFDKSLNVVYIYSPLSSIFFHISPTSDKTAYSGFFSKLFCKTSWTLEAVNDFWKIAPSSMSERVSNAPWLSMVRSQVWNNFVLKIFRFLSWLCGHVEKWFNQKDKVNFKIYDVTISFTNNVNTHIEYTYFNTHIIAYAHIIYNCNTHITYVHIWLQYTYNCISIHIFTCNTHGTWEIFFLKNHTQNVVEKLFPDPFLKIKFEHISESIV